MSEKIIKLGFIRESKFFYHLNKAGNLIKFNPKKKPIKKEIVKKLGLKKESGYIYFLDKEGDISRAKMRRDGRKKNPRHQND